MSEDSHAVEPEPVIHGITLKPGTFGDHPPIYEVTESRVQDVPSHYSGACWNALMEEETKESIARMLIDGMDERDQFRAALQEALEHHDFAVKTARFREDVSDAAYKAVNAIRAVVEAMR